jgi:hypothetical protein
MIDSEARYRLIDELLAKQAIQEALYRYCRGEDRLNGALSESLWHPEGTAEYGHRGSVFAGSVSGWASRIHPTLAKFTGSSHQVSNVLIEVDGDRAVSEAYVSVTLWKMSRDVKVWQRTLVGRYLDQWSRRAGRWGVDHRRFIFDFSQESEPTRTQEPEYYEGRHGAEDPSYEVLRSLRKSCAQ